MKILYVYFIFLYLKINKIPLKCYFFSFPESSKLILIEQMDIQEPETYSEGQESVVESSLHNEEEIPEHGKHSKKLLED